MDVFINLIHYFFRWWTDYFAICDLWGGGVSIGAGLVGERHNTSGMHIFLCVTAFSRNWNAHAGQRTIPLIWSLGQCLGGVPKQIQLETPLSLPSYLFRGGIFSPNVFNFTWIFWYRLLMCRLLIKSLSVCIGVARQIDKDGIYCLLSSSVVGRDIAPMGNHHGMLS